MFLLAQGKAVKDDAKEANEHINVDEVRGINLCMHEWDHL